jgi:YHS domain-containing protein
MNATFRFAVKACVMAAVSGALFNQAAGIFAQDDQTAQTDGSASSRIRRTASYQPQAPSQPGTQQPSEVQKKLQELYRKDGREMPSMNMEDLPNTQPIVTPPAAAAQTAPTGTSAPTGGGSAPKASKPNFFERLFRVGKGRKQPAPAAAQPARPAAPPMQPYRNPQVQQPTRPAAPVYRPPLVSAPAPRPTAQPQLREPAPIGSLANPSEVTARPATPALRPGQRSGIGQPLMDDADSQEDSESLELNQDDQKKKVASQPPQILPNQSANGPAESPFTGVKIAPNEMEQRIASAAKPAIEAAPAVKAESPERKIVVTQPATGPAFGDAGPVVANVPPVAKSPAATKTDDLGIKDEDDDDDDDDEPLTLSTDASGKTAPKPIEPIAEKPAKEFEKPAVSDDMKGFRGFCPVVLKDERKLIEARPQIQSEYRGKVYTFSSVDAKEAFEENPRKYIPAGDGHDVVKQMAGEEGVEGTLEHAAWYRGRLYLFSSAESRRVFVETPSKFVVND